MTTSQKKPQKAAAKGKAKVKEPKTVKKPVQTPKAAQKKAAPIKAKADAPKAVKKAAPKKKVPAKPQTNPKATKAAGKSIPQKPKPQPKMETKTMPPKQTFPGTENFEQIAQDAATFQRESAEAMMQSGNIFFRGFEEMMRTATAMAQESAEKQANFMKEAMGARNVNDFAAIQNKIAQSNMDDMMAGATKLTELSVKVLSESAEPVSQQMTKAMNQTKKAA